MRFIILVATFQSVVGITKLICFLKISNFISWSKYKTQKFKEKNEKNGKIGEGKEKRKVYGKREKKGKNIDFWLFLVR